GRTERPAKAGRSQPFGPRSSRAQTPSMHASMRRSSTIVVALLSLFAAVALGGCALAGGSDNDPKAQAVIDRVAGSADKLDSAKLVGTMKMTLPAEAQQALGGSGLTASFGAVSKREGSTYEGQGNFSISLAGKNVEMTFLTVDGKSYLGY